MSNEAVKVGNGITVADLVRTLLAAIGRVATSKPCPDDLVPGFNGYRLFLVRNNTDTTNTTDTNTNHTELQDEDQRPLLPVLATCFINPDDRCRVTIVTDPAQKELSQIVAGVLMCWCFGVWVRMDCSFRPPPAGAPPPPLAPPPPPLAPPPPPPILSERNRQADRLRYKLTVGSFIDASSDQRYLVLIAQMEDRERLVRSRFEAVICFIH